MAHSLGLERPETSGLSRMWSRDLKFKISKQDTSIKGERGKGGAAGGEKAAPGQSWSVCLKNNVAGLAWTGARWQGSEPSSPAFATDSWILLFIFDSITWWLGHVVKKRLNLPRLAFWVYVKDVKFKCEKYVCCLQEKALSTRQLTWRQFKATSWGQYNLDTNTRTKSVPQAPDLFISFCSNLF